MGNFNGYDCDIIENSAREYLDPHRVNGGELASDFGVGGIRPFRSDGSVDNPDILATGIYRYFNIYQIQG